MECERSLLEKQRHKTALVLGGISSIGRFRLDFINVGNILWKTRLKN